MSDMIKLRDSGRKYYHATRINGTCYLEEFQNGRGLRLIGKLEDIPRDEWDSMYAEYAAISDVLNRLLALGDGE